ncbi:MAG: hypothetical protein RPU52_00310 [Candidatus Sedimenticola sp. (ex Thyasira tokunagai)]
MTMTWVARPPVKKETGPGAVAAITTLIQNIRDVHRSHKRDLDTIGARGTESWENAQEYRGLSPRVIYDATTMSDLFGGARENREYYIYRINMVPVAVMELLVVSDHVKIKNLLAHPLAMGAGGAMVEVAINAKDWGSDKPVVKLSALPSAQPAYKGLGFVLISGMAMTLDLNTPHRKWNCLGGYWQYTPSSGDTSFLADI